MTVWGAINAITAIELLGKGKSGNWILVWTTEGDFTNVDHHGRYKDAARGKKRAMHTFTKSSIGLMQDPNAGRQHWSWLR